MLMGDPFTFDEMPAASKAPAPLKQTDATTPAKGSRHVVGLCADFNFYESHLFIPNIT